MTAATRPMLATYPGEINLDRDLLARSIDALLACAQACTSCADSCLSEADVAQLVKCIRTDLDCADVCSTTARVLSRHTGYDANLSRSLLEACATACRSCADECDRHAKMHEHCRICAEACRVAERASREVLAAMSR
ncbi:four-helix bundle copper-binding protein [Plantactinospora sp. ZYX-F-223]|uniref:four-helix bundle copper-binding protein n=1 Tax=Plantactinospora sp. ZYX-F-223 TaxID=3144103 RepID=UPI0031FC18AC